MAAMIPVSLASQLFDSGAGAGGAFCVLAPCSSLVRVRTFVVSTPAAADAHADGALPSSSSSFSSSSDGGDYYFLKSKALSW